MNKKIKFIFRHGILAGIIAGASLLILKIFAYGFLYKDFMYPLNFITEIFYSKNIDTFSNNKIILLGLIIHIVLSIIFGIIVAFLIRNIDKLKSKSNSIIIFCIGFSILLFVFNYFVVPRLGYVKVSHSNLYIELTSHIFGFGEILGIYFSKILKRA